MNLSKLSGLYAKQREVILQLGFKNTRLYLANLTTAKLSVRITFNKYYFVSQPLNTEPVLPNINDSKLCVIELPPETLNTHPCPRHHDVLVDRYKEQTSIMGWAIFFTFGPRANYHFVTCPIFSYFWFRKLFSHFQIATTSISNLKEISNVFAKSNYRHFGTGFTA